MKSLDNLKKRIAPYLAAARKNAALIFVVFLLAIYGFLTWQIMQLLQAEPTASDVSAQLNTVGAPKVDDNTINKMESLIQSNADVHSFYDESRSNPFKE
jgi:predicted negative regulator of RcsB-dependent stress response